LEGKRGQGGRDRISRDLGLEAASQFYSRIKKPMEDYFEAMGVPRRYADIMWRTSSQEIYVPHECSGGNLAGARPVELKTQLQARRFADASFARPAEME
jgi:hypothetical protein